MTVSDDDLRRGLIRLLDEERVLTSPIQRIAYASDASFYRMIPRAVVQPRSIDEVRALFRYSHNRKVPLTFRAGGTSLSGQALSDGILVDIGRHWRGIEVLADRRVRVQPGAIGGLVNRTLRPHGAKIGPDPASIDACMIGGILANNASGMCCGVEHNSYHTLDSLTFVLPDGTCIDTGAADADQRFVDQAPVIAGGLLKLKRRMEDDPALCARIRSKYRRKNTTGYALNAVLDHHRAVDIMRHLLIGSEGTLGFIAEAVLRTIPDLPWKATSLLLFASIAEAADAIAPLAASGAAALEIMDRAALRSIENLHGAPAVLAQLGRGAAAVLAEYHAADRAALDALVVGGKEVLARLRLLYAASFTRDPVAQAALWKLRKGMFPSVGAVRAQGTSVILEDVVFPVERLAEAIGDLQRLFTKHGYRDAIIFGHAKEGNLHFVVSQAFNDDREVARYRDFIEELVRLVVERYDGALKAEHGTGRNMAPFVEAEWGGEAYALMCDLKRLIDPEQLLNPGVIINHDRQAHVRHLKSLPVVEAEIDKCIECGFCEPKCPSRDLSLTPRQRIVVRREMARLGANGEDPALLAHLVAEHQYQSLDTCATDGLCATACPVAIDTGALVKRLRNEQHSDFAQRVALGVSRSLPLAERAARTGLRLGHLGEAVIGRTGMGAVSAILRAAGVPGWAEHMPPAARPLPASDARGASAVYFSSCLTRTMGGKGRALPEVVADLARRAGLPILMPENAAGTCCGMAFSSKGYDQAAADSANRAVERCWEWSHRGSRPIVVDTCACTYTLKQSGPLLTAENREHLGNLRILDLIEFVHDSLLSHLPIAQLPERVALHPVCATTKLGLVDKLTAIAQRCAREAVVPVNLGCCGFAGDRGLLVPELTSAATAEEAAEVGRQTYDGYYSCSRTCEQAMEQATGKAYTSFAHLVERAVVK